MIPPLVQNSKGFKVKQNITVWHEQFSWESHV